MAKLTYKIFQQKIACQKTDGYRMNLDGVVNLDEATILDYASHDSGIREEQLRAVWLSMARQIKELVANAIDIPLGDLGTLGFRFKYRAGSALKEANSEMVYRKGIRFRNSAKLRKACKDVEIRRSTRRGNVHTDVEP